MKITLFIIVLCVCGGLAGIAATGRVWPSALIAGGIGGGAGWVSWEIDERRKRQA